MNYAMKGIAVAETESLVRDQSRLIYAMAITFALWQAGDILMQMSEVGGSFFHYAGLVKIGGAIAYAISALCFFLLYCRVKKAGAAAILRDDWSRFARGLALQYGFFFLIGTTSLMYAVSMFWPLPILPILQVILTIGVSGTLLAFVILYNQGGD
ncbi:hypothetical protein [Altererythrobacter sp.]|uniref:hypothetical protein n=1 Tax=Altererythrobacter sp. TaxID=1872480 RepID=UPI003D0597D1